jgi:hypothetical protein
LGLKNPGSLHDQEKRDEELGRQPLLADYGGWDSYRYGLVRFMIGIAGECPGKKPGQVKPIENAA